MDRPSTCKAIPLFVIAAAITTLSVVTISNCVLVQGQNQTQGQNTNMSSSFNITAASKYNEMLNPRQIQYPAHLGFNDLHIEAINHIDPNATAGYNAAFLDTVVHHHCKVYDDMTAACLLFLTGMGDQDKPYGVEYVIPSDLYIGLPEEDKKYWHYQKQNYLKCMQRLLI